ncbi:MAG: hypothetical protein CSA66_00245 [Proteobacteria bacterium]|nr:MAG: hypothetical protein CSA66_00245 [Pseudomonadota bacterium]
MASTAVNDLHLRMREATHRAHESLEEQGYSVALADGTLAVEQLARSLADWRIVYEAVEARADDLGDVWRPWMARTERIDADLALLPKVEGRGACAADFAELVRSVEPDALAGILYVLEGSAMGGMVLVRSVRKIAGPDVGAFHAPYGKETRQKFVGFLQRLGDLDPDVDRVLAGAAAGFEHIARMTAEWSPPAA